MVGSLTQFIKAIEAPLEPREFEGHALHVGGALVASVELGGAVCVWYGQVHYRDIAANIPL